MTAVPTPDEPTLSAFWQRVLAAGAVEPGTARPADVGAFGDSPAMADSLVELVVSGPKRATAGSVAEYEHDRSPFPQAGGLWICTDGRGRPRALIRTTEVRIGPLSSVDEAFAWDEGEGDRTRADWLRSHEGYFARVLPSIGVAFDPDMPTIFERFEVLHAE